MICELNLLDCVAKTDRSIATDNDVAVQSPRFCRKDSLSFVNTRNPQKCPKNAKKYKTLKPKYLDPLPRKPALDIVFQTNPKRGIYKYKLQEHIV